MAIIRMTERELVKYLDQTNVTQEANKKEMRRVIQEARKHGFWGMAILPAWVPLAVCMLEGSDTHIVAAIDFPMGTLPTEQKVKQVQWVTQNAPAGAEFDTVLNRTWLKAGEYERVREDILAVVEAAKGHTVKSIIEMPDLTRDQVVIACLLSELAGAHYIKTSTGFKGFPFMRPSTAEDVRLIKSVVGDRLKVKAAGGISTVEQVLALIEAGASRIGTSSGVAIVQGFRKLKVVV